VEVKASLGGAVATGGAVGVRVTRGPGETLDSRVAALEANLAELDRVTEGRFGEMNERLTTAEQRAAEVRAYIDEMRQAQEEARREELRGSMPWQWMGTGLFAVGALLGMWTNLAC
jgi:hypothetical protein